MRHHHIDEIDNDYATHVSQPNLSRDFSRRFEIDFQDCFFLVVSSHIASTVHIDCEECLGLVQYQVTAASEPGSPLRSLLDFLLNPKGVEDRRFVAVVFDFLPQMRGDAFEISDDFLVFLFGVDDQSSDFIGEQIPYQA